MMARGLRVAHGGSRDIPSSTPSGGGHFPQPSAASPTTTSPAAPLAAPALGAYATQSTDAYTLPLQQPLSTAGKPTLPSTPLPALFMGFCFASGTVTFPP